MQRVVSGSIKATNSDRIQEKFSKYDIIGMARKCI